MGCLRTLEDTVNNKIKSFRFTRGANTCQIILCPFTLWTSQSIKQPKLTKYPLLFDVFITKTWWYNIHTRFAQQVCNIIFIIFALHNGRHCLAIADRGDTHVNGIVPIFAVITICYDEQTRAWKRLWLAACDRRGGCQTKFWRGQNP